MDDDSSRTVLSWSNVALALSFVLFDTAVSAFYRLGISSSLLTAALRCIVQLSIMGLVLQNIFETKSPWGVAGLARAYNRVISPTKKLIEICSSIDIIRNF